MPSLAPEQLYYERMMSMDDIVPRNAEREVNVGNAGDGESLRTEYTEDRCSEHPIIDEFYMVDGNNALLKLIHFTYEEFLAFYKNIEPEVTAHLSNRRRPKPKQSDMDLVFMLLVTMRIGSKWPVAAKFFRMKTNTFHKKISFFAWLIVHKMKTAYIINVNQIRQNSRQSFNYFPWAKYATYVMFQKPHKPLGSFEQVKPWFSKKHENYGYKTEIVVSADGMTVMVTPHRPGRTADIEISREFLDIQLNNTTKFDKSNEKPKPRPTREIRDKKNHTSVEIF